MKINLGFCDNCNQLQYDFLLKWCHTCGFVIINGERMSPEITPKTKKQLIEWFFHKLETESRGMTDWESGFIESIKSQYETNGTISEAQYNTLEKIYAERT